MSVAVKKYHQENENGLIVYKRYFVPRLLMFVFANVILYNAHP